MEMAAAAPQREPERESDGWLFMAGILLVSLVLHAVTLWNLPHETVRERPARIEIVDFKPPPPPKVEEKPPEPPPPPPPPKERPKPQPKVKVEAPPPPVDAPPPPNDPPAQPNPGPPPPLIVGISLSSTSEAGGISVPVGNTTYGKADKVVPPSEVKPYAAPKYVPPGGADSEPALAEGGEVKIPYPEEAKAAGIEGIVRLRVKIDETGKVEEVSIINGPGYGLNEAARDAMRRFKFKPALKNGQPVGTTITYNYTFYLD